MSKPRKRRSKPVQNLGAGVRARFDDVVPVVPLEPAEVHEESIYPSVAFEKVEFEGIPFPFVVAREYIAAGPEIAARVTLHHVLVWKFLPKPAGAVGFVV